MIRLIIASLAMCVGATAAQAAGCHIDPFNFVWGGDTSTHMTVKSGQTCTETMRHGQGSGPKETVISQPAANGTASALSRDVWQYAARRGFTGKDSFVVATTGESMSNRGRASSGTTHISVDVDVVP